MGGFLFRFCRVLGFGMVFGVVVVDGIMEVVMELGGEKMGCEVRGFMLIELKVNGKVLVVSGGLSVLGG